MSTCVDKMRFVGRYSHEETGRTNRMHVHDFGPTILIFRSRARVAVTSSCTRRRSQA